MSKELDMTDEPKNEDFEETMTESTTEIEPAKEKPNIVEISTVDLEALKKEIADTVAKREKDKLYPTLEKYKNELKAAQEKIKEYEEKHLSTEELMSKKLQEANSAIAELTAKMEAIAEEATKEIYNVKLESHKEKMLLQYKDEIIPELVVGNTIEEITKNAEKAHRKYIEIRDREIARIKEETKAARQTVKTSTGISPTNTSDEGLTEIDSVLDKAKPEEWEALKAKLLAIAKKS